LSDEVHPALHNLITTVKQTHPSIVDQLNGGFKPDEETIKVIVKVAEKIAATYKTKE